LEAKEVVQWVKCLLPKKKKKNQKTKKTKKQKKKKTKKTEKNNNNKNNPMSVVPRTHVKRRMCALVISARKGWRQADAWDLPS
jgi:DNA recombination-dependent growth factor C